jgi:ethylbenzene dehydrogenase/cytochrome b561-like protein
MSRRKIRNRKTDYGTIILHWTLVVSLVVALLSGLRIATEAPDRTWINLLDRMLPSSSVWTAHMPAALVLVTVAVAYAIYMWLSGLARRVRLDRIRVLGLFGNRHARWGAINIVLYWGFFVTLLLQLATGGLLYFGYTQYILVTLHWFGTWAILGYAALHVLAHLKLGGKPQLLRIFRPAPLVPPPPPLDPIQLLMLLAEHTGPATSPPMAAEQTPDTARTHALAGRHPQPTRRPDGARHDPPASARPSNPPRPRADNADGRKPRRGPVLQANPFIIAISIAIFGAFFLVAIDRKAVDTLYVRRIDASELPMLDGDTSDRVWRTARPLYMSTGQGGNFDDKGETTIEVRAVHDGNQAYFLFAWDDPTRSLKHLPLIKKADGWHLLHDGYEVGDEHAYNEDKFSVLLTTLDVVLAGDRTFHAGPEPIAGQPRTLSGRGLHYTMDDQTYADVWEWKATSTGPWGYMDDDHFGPPVKATQVEMRGMMPYHGGFSPDPGTANYADNFDPRLPESYGLPLKPRRLPKDLKATLTAMGPTDLDPSVGESEGARWFMTESESTYYSPELDARIPVGTAIPGVIVSGTFSGDRADVRCAARWAAGRWALEVSRRLDTNSKYDVPIKTGTFLRVAAFDHSQIRHTRHVRPIRVEVE